jgi:chromosome segregation ATPase
LQELAVFREKLRSAEQDYLPFEDIEGVYGRVADLIKVKDYEYLRAVEVAGGQRLSFVQACRVCGKGQKAFGGEKGNKRAPRRD